MKTPALVVCSFTLLPCFAAVPTAKQMRGPFPIKSTPYFEDGAVGRTAELTAAKPVIHSALAGWGGWQWLIQLRHCGCDGLVAEVALQMLEPPQAPRILV